MTVSGPPATLARFFEHSAEFAKDRLALPVYGPYHASHLHEKVDAKEILGDHIPIRLSTSRQTINLVSTSSGQCFDATLDASELLAAVIDDVLRCRLDLGKVVNACAGIVKASSPVRCKVMSFGPNSAEDTFIKALQSEDMDVVVQESVSERISPFNDMPRTSKKPKLAIVGMAGRFPNAADHEKFWDLLEAGLDVHKKV